MLIAYTEPLALEQLKLLTRWEQHVRYWPRSYAFAHHPERFPIDYWLLFYRETHADLWLLRYSAHSIIVSDLV